MPFASILQRIVLPFFKAREPGVFDVVTPDGEFRRLLSRERARSSRNRSPFSIIIFETAGEKRSGELIRKLVSSLCLRLRETDAIGWFGRNVAAFLPDTPADGASRVGIDVARMAGSEQHPLPHRIHAYPFDSPDDGAGGRRQLRFSDICPAWDGGAPSQDAAATTPRESAQRVCSSGGVFVRPMPFSKRAMDIAGALVGLIVFSPVFLLAALAVKLTSRGPIVFRQERTGLGGKRFTLLKFRTMVVGAEAMRERLLRFNEQDGPAFKMRRDPRVTWVGRYLRTTSIDEMPQLLNVLRGDMSLVGPRPLRCAEADACLPWQRQRLDVTPGLTCTWQVFGRSRVSFDEWVRMDIRYANNRTLLYDLKLLLMTVPAVLLRRGAF